MPDTRDHDLAHDLPRLINRHGVIVIDDQGRATVSTIVPGCCDGPYSF